MKKDTQILVVLVCSGVLLIIALYILRIRGRAAPPEDGQKTNQGAPGGTGSGQPGAGKEPPFGRGPGRRDSQPTGGGFFPPRGNSKASTDPQTACQQADQLRRQAEQLARKGQYGRAYQQALQGWQVLRSAAPQNPDQNPEYQSLLRQLETLLQEYGDLANDNAHLPPLRRFNDKPYVMK